MLGREPGIFVTSTLVAILRALPVICPVRIIVSNVIKELLKSFLYKNKVVVHRFDEHIR